MDFFEEWVSCSKSDLDKARDSYESHHYDEVLYHLQQADEKAAKALLYRLGLVTGEEELGSKEALDEIFGIKKTGTVDYNHDWLMTRIFRLFNSTKKYLLSYYVA